MTQNGPANVPVPAGATTQDERTMAVLAQVLQLVGGWIAPLVIFFLRRQSRFVTFHALQVLLFEAVVIFFTMISMGAIFLFVMVSVAPEFPHQEIQHRLPPFFLAFFGVFWVSFALIWFVRLLLAIVYGVKASRGEWAEYPLLGRLARKILTIGPGGALIES